MIRSVIQSVIRSVIRSMVRSVIRSDPGSVGAAIEVKMTVLTVTA